MRIILLAQLRAAYDGAPAAELLDHSHQPHAAAAAAVVTKDDAAAAVASTAATAGGRSVRAVRQKPRRWEAIARKTRLAMIVAWFNAQHPPVPLTMLVRHVDDLEVDFDGYRIVNVAWEKAVKAAAA